jgi:ribosomal protein S7
MSIKNQTLRKNKFVKPLSRAKPRTVSQKKNHKSFQIQQFHPNLADELSPINFDLFFKKLTNLLMIDGKKIKAFKIVKDMLYVLKKRIKNDLEKKNQSFDISEYLSNNLSSQTPFPVNFGLLRILSRALENLTPSLEVRKVRVAGSTYMVPALLSKKKQETLALKWVIESAKKRRKNSKFNFSACLADEFLDASRKLGQARQKRDELHRIAQMNRAYIRYRWW